MKRVSYANFSPSTSDHFTVECGISARKPAFHQPRLINACARCHCVFHRHKVSRSKNGNPARPTRNLFSPRLPKCFLHHRDSLDVLYQFLFPSSRRATQAPNLWSPDSWPTANAIFLVFMTCSCFSFLFSLGAPSCHPSGCFHLDRLPECWM